MDTAITAAALAELEVARQTLPNDSGLFETDGFRPEASGTLGRIYTEASSEHLSSTRATLTRSTRSRLSYGGFRRYAEQKSKLTIAR